MSKRDRHPAILRLVREQHVTSQELLRDLLVKEGFDVTQATVSRDVRDLRLVKVPGATGAAHYTLPDEWENAPLLQTLLPALFVSAEGTGNLLVVRTLIGAAQTVASAVDWEEWAEVLGTIAGDDTILIICREEGQREHVRQRLETLAHRG